MADKVEYVVRIVGLGGEDESGEKKEDKTSSLSSGLKGLQKALTPVKSSIQALKSNPETYYIGEIAGTVITNVSNDISLSVNRYFRLSEDYKNQNNLTNITSNINRAKSFGMSTLGTAMVGAKLGVGGAVFGAIIGAASNIWTQRSQWNNTVANFNASMNATKVETEFRAKRAGLYDGGKGTEN